MKHSIWSNHNLKLEDWRDDLLEEYPNASEAKLKKLMEDTNEDYLGDEQMNLLGTTAPAIVVVAKIRKPHVAANHVLVIRTKEKRDSTVSVSRCLNRWELGFQYGFPNAEHSNEDKNDVKYEWYVASEDGEFRCNIYYKDCLSDILYRGVKSDVDLDVFEEQLLNAHAINDSNWFEKLMENTYRLGDDIGKVYGWKFDNADSKWHNFGDINFLDGGGELVRKSPTGEDGVYEVLSLNTEAGEGGKEIMAFLYTVSLDMIEDFDIKEILYGMGLENDDLYAGKSCDEVIALLTPERVAKEYVNCGLAALGHVPCVNADGDDFTCPNPNSTPFTTEEKVVAWLKSLGAGEFLPDDMQDKEA